MAPGHALTSSAREDLEDLQHDLKRQGLQAEVYPDDSLSSHWNLISSGGSIPDRIANLFRSVRRLIDCVTGFDLVHVVYLPGTPLATVILPLILVARFLGRRVVLDYRSPVLLNRIGGKTMLFAKLWKLCDRVLVPSAYQRQLVNSLGGRADYTPPVVNVHEMASRIVRTIQPRVVIAADLEREHAVVCAIRAHSIVKQKYPRTELVIVGSGPQRTALERMIEGMKISGVTFAGPLPRAQRWECFQSCDLYVNCSTVDYLSTATVEAFASGLPVLTTPVTGAVDMFRGYQNIVLLTYGDHTGLANRIIRLMEDPDLTEKLSRNSRDTAEKYAQWASQQACCRFYSKFMASDDA